MKQQEAPFFCTGSMVEQRNASRNTSGSPAHQVAEPRCEGWSTDEGRGHPQPSESC